MQLGKNILFAPRLARAARRCSIEISGFYRDDAGMELFVCANSGVFFSGSRESFQLDSIIAYGSPHIVFLLCNIIYASWMTMIMLVVFL